MHYKMKRVLSPDFISTVFILIKTSLFKPFLHPAGISGGMWEEGRRGKKVIHGVSLSRMEVQQSAQPMFASDDGLFEWSAQPSRITGWKKKGEMNTDTTVSAHHCSLEALVREGPFPLLRECVGIVSF